MHPTSILLAFSFAFATTSSAMPNASPRNPTILPRKHGNNTDSSPKQMLNRECKKIRKLEKLTSLASNETKLNELVTEGRITAAQVTELQAKAANATTALESLQSNATLVAECDVVNARGKDLKQCNTLQRLAHLAELAGNKSAVEEFAAKKGLNETRLNQKVTEAKTKLKEMEANTTLTDFCAQSKLELEDGNDDTKSVAGTGTAQAVTKSGAATLQAVSYLLAPALVGFLVVVA